MKLQLVIRYLFGVFYRLLRFIGHSSMVTPNNHLGVSVHFSAVSRMRIKRDRGVIIGPARILFATSHVSNRC
jgi:hypothetical protein